MFERNAVQDRTKRGSHQILYSTFLLFINKVNYFSNSLICSITENLTVQYIEMSVFLTLFWLISLPLFSLQPFESAYSFVSLEKEY